VIAVADELTVSCNIRNCSFRCCSGGRRKTEVFQFRPASQLLRGYATITPARRAARLVQTMIVRTDCDACVWVSPMNLCPCGYHGDPLRVSTCAAGVLVGTRIGSQLGPRRKRPPKLRRLLGLRWRKRRVAVSRPHPGPGRRRGGPTAPAADYSGPGDAGQPLVKGYTMRLWSPSAGRPRRTGRSRLERAVQIFDAGLSTPTQRDEASPCI
jgi:hypothetical protein